MPTKKSLNPLDPADANVIGQARADAQTSPAGRQLATSDPEAHQQAIADAEADAEPLPDYLTRPDIDEALGLLSDIASILAFILTATLGHELTEDGEIKPIAGKGKGG